MKEAKEDSKKSLEQGYEVLQPAPTRIQPKQNSRLTGEEMDCEDGTTNPEMDD